MTDKTETTPEPQACLNTDRELWREKEGDYYSPSIHVTKEGGIGIDVGGFVITMPLRGWHRLAAPNGPPSIAEMENPDNGWEKKDAGF